MAVRFDTSGEYLRRNTGLPSASVFTMCLWGQLVVDTNTYQSFLSYDLAASNQYLQLGTTSDGTTLFFFVSTSGDMNMGALTVGQWYFLAMVKNGTSCTAYIGTPGSTLTSFATTSSGTYAPTDIYLGSSGYGDGFNGKISAFKCWDGVVLSQAELEQERRYNMPVCWQNLYCWLPMDTVSGVDLSGARRDFTVNGTLAVEPGAPIAWAPRSEPLWVPYVTAADPYPPFPAYQNTLIRL